MVGQAQRPVTETVEVTLSEITANKRNIRNE
jgi:hypothetical protein